MASFALPYLTLADDEVHVGAWEYRLPTSAEWQPLPEFVPHWDYALGFRIRRSFRASASGIARVFDGAEGRARLGVVVTLRSGSGRGSLAVELARADLDADDRGATVEADAPSGALAERMLLQSQIVTLDRVTDSSPLVPARAGCRIWADEQAVRLTGIEARLPMELISFADQHRSIARAPWFVHWSPGDWERDFMASVVVMVNDDTSESREAILRSEESALRQIVVDMISDVVAGYLADPETGLRRDWPERSLGSVVESWIDALQGDDLSRAQLRSWIAEAPGMVRARVAHTFSRAGRTGGVM